MNILIKRPTMEYSTTTSMQHLNKYARSDYTARIYEHLSEEIKQRFEFCSVSSHPHRGDTIEAAFSGATNKPKIIFDHEDEWHRIPPYYERDDVAIIVKDYSPYNYSLFKKILPLPVVFNHEYPFEPQIPIEDRIYLLFSSLWASPSRRGVKDALTVLEGRKDCKILWNDGFATGLPFKEYQKEMRKSIISVCCSGYMSAEIARIHEALTAGNIIITSRRPPYPFYEGNPFIIYDDPKEIPEIVCKIESLSIEEKRELVEKGNRFYEDKYSATAIARQIEDFLLNTTTHISDHKIEENF